MIHEKLRNYDLGRKRLAEVGQKPSNISALPIFQESQKHDGLVDEAESYGARSESDDESSDDGKREKDAVRDREVLEEREGKANPVRVDGEKTPVATVPCGVMPVGARLSDFHHPPQKAHARN